MSGVAAVGGLDADAVAAAHNLEGGMGGSPEAGCTGKFPDSDFGSESLSAQLRENFCRAHTYIFSPSCTLIGAILLYFAVACCISPSLYRLLSRNVIIV